MVNTVNYKKYVNINIFDDKYDALNLVANQLRHLNNEKKVNVAISGGSSPIKLFEIMRDEYKQEDFCNINFYWVDERFVEVESDESNYGNFKRILVDTNIIKKDKVYPMYKKDDINQTINKITKEIKNNVTYYHDLPRFDLVLLGLGEDGHTASLFPDNLKSMSSKNIIIETENPYSKQKRLTLTKNVINNSKKIYFLTFSLSKAYIVNQVLGKKYADLPATYIKRDSSVFWFLDKEAASLLDTYNNSKF